jgi:hypothetical protein
MLQPQFIQTTGYLNMEITKKIAEIDQEISTRKSDKFGIKVGGELYRALAKAGKITKEKFSWLETKLFSEELPAYDGKYFVYHDWELDDWDFKIGTPAL